MQIDHGVHYGLALINRIDGKPVALTIRRDQTAIEKTIQPQPQPLPQDSKAHIKPGG